MKEIKNRFAEVPFKTNILRNKLCNDPIYLLAVQKNSSKVTR